MADVAHDAIDVEVAGRNAVAELNPTVTDLDHIAVLCEQHVALGHTHLDREAGVM